MAIVAPVVDGEIQQTTSSSTETEKKTGSGSSLDKDAFLQLLVAQMKYQDPLEPTSNTEYISQFAQFSSLEQMQNVRSAVDLQRASSLVGQEVYVKSTNATTGKVESIYGKVDYVVFENGKAYLSINENLYPMDDLDSVYNPDYTEAFDTAYDWTVSLNKLPAVGKITLSNGDDIDALKEKYEAMTDYQKSFVTSENKEKLDNYVARLEEIRKKAEESEKDDEKDDTTDEVTDKDDTKTDETGDGGEEHGEDTE